MQGNWNGSSGGVGGVPTSATSAAVAVAAGGTTVTLASKGQQQQHQGLLQQINGEIHHHGTTAGGDIIPHSPTTPAWNIADRIVKEELPEDKNNDSGVSPGHYTSNSVSPRSRRSSSTANGSLSPGSATSQDSSAMQYEYSPQRLFKSYGGNDLSALHNNGSNRSLQLGQNRDMEQPVDVVSSTMKQESDDSDNSHQTSNMQCPVCPFNTAHRMQFNDHLTSHCAPSKRESSAEYSPSSYVQEDGARGSPSQGERSEREFDDDEPGLRVPQQNCQGKVKTFKCKQCNFVAVTKLAFWEHSRVHIKAEKLLTCPRCPFVTAYKHHLEYHLRNHFNSKPFKCDICPYSCVNQSMLNSHSKSHSNVYQYRCAECSYATKYCHSLKLHLRKYKHNPAMVLNPDGSPNPLPIIDIYGTRRGPKQKPTRKSSNEDANNKSNSATQNSAGIKIAAQFPSEHNLIQNSGLTLNVPFSYGQFFNAVGNSMPTIGAGNGSVGHFLHQFHDSNHNLQNDNRNNKQFDLFGFKLNDDYNDVKRMTNSPVGSSLQQPFSNSNSINSNNSKSTTELFYESSPTALTDEPEVVDMSLISSSPLDLSKPEIGTKNHKTNSPRGGGTSRRKGKAFKLDKLIVARDSEDDDNDDDSGSNKIFQEPMITDFVRENVVVGNIKSENNNHDDRDVIDCNDDDGASGNGDNNVSSGGNNSDYNCQYCDIAFGNVVMYTMHMGYHGYKNPYTCNMCGHECADKVSFFLHIARDSHS